MTSKPSDSFHQGASTGYSASITSGVSLSGSLDEPTKPQVPLPAICTEFVFVGQGGNKGSSLKDVSFALIVSHEGVYEVSLPS